MVPIVIPRRGGRKATPGQLAVIFLVLALLFLGLGAFVGQDAEGILQHRGTAQGTVVGLEARKGGDKQPRATVRYEVGGSTVWLMNQRVRRDAREGDAVTVVYDRREPAHASLKSPGELRAIWVMLVGLGAAALVGAALAFGASRRTGGAPPAAMAG